MLSHFRPERSIPLQTGMIDTINSPPGSIEAYSWWEFLSYGQKPYQYFADAYIMANKDWMQSLPDDLQQLVLKVGAELVKFRRTLFWVPEKTR